MKMLRRNFFIIAEDPQHLVFATEYWMDSIEHSLLTMIFHSLFKIFWSRWLYVRKFVTSMNFPLKKSKFQNFVSPQNSIVNHDYLPRESTLIWCIITYLAKWNIRWMNLGPPGERNNDATTEGKLFPHSS